MSRRMEGIGASPGRALAPARWLDWDIPPVEHRTIRPADVDREVARFDRARSWALEQVERLRGATAERLGELEAKVFESQAMMIEDPDLVEGTIAYIRDNYLSAERAFDWHMLEIRVRILDAAHAMVLDRLADLHDVRTLVLTHLLDRPAAADWVGEEGDPAILVARDLTPSIAARLHPDRVRGFVTGGGSRGSHSVLLARGLGIPAVVGVGPRLEEIPDGVPTLVDGRTGRVIIDPVEGEIAAFRRAEARARERREELERRAGRPAETRDGVRCTLMANLDQPDEAEEAVRLGAEGVGLFRTEFLVIGRRVIPDEDEQYEAYRRVAETVHPEHVTLRTFDIGGDKFPMFLAMPPEENPYLGWRAIRVCLDLPDLFRNQLGAACRAAEHGPIRLMLPFVASVEEVRRSRELLREVCGARDRPRPELGVMVETPAALETLDLLAPYVEFVSLGTNDLTQYTMAADRGNARLSTLYDPLQPALVRCYARLARECRRLDLELSVCGELASDPAGVCVLLALGYRRFSTSLAALPEVRETIRSASIRELETLPAELARLETPGEIRERVAGLHEACGGLPQA